MNANVKQTAIVLIGTLVGHIWMPCAECTKDARIEFAPHLGPFHDDFRHSDGSKPSARDFALKATNDGDFQSCSLTADSFVRIERRTWTGTTWEVRVREFPVTAFPSMADCVDSRESWEVEPDWDDDED